MRIGLTEVVSYASPKNSRSQAVMNRLRMERAPSRDFTADYGLGCLARHCLGSEAILT